MSKPPTNFTSFGAPTGSAITLLALPPILSALARKTFVLFGPPSIASTPRSLAGKGDLEIFPKI
eukprot:11520107-Heterocapsa_arctica.AAC.1